MGGVVALPLIDLACLELAFEFPAAEDRLATEAGIGTGGVPIKASP